MERIEYILNQLKKISEIMGENNFSNSLIEKYI